MSKINIFILRRMLSYNLYDNCKFFRMPLVISNHFKYFSTTNTNQICPTLYLSKELKDLNSTIHSGIDKTKDNAEDNTNTLEKHLDNEESSKLDVDEEMLRYDYEEFEEREDELIEVEEELPLYRVTRGKENVYDLEDLMLLLTENKAINACVLKIPEKYDYCDYMVIVTGTSVRHLRAMAEDIKKTYKRKRMDGDPWSVDIEGMLSKNWLAMDLGNIVVHLFLEETRQLYDLEQLWSVGSDFDEQSQVAEAANQSSSKYVANFMKEFDAELKKFKALSKKES